MIKLFNPENLVYVMTLLSKLYIFVGFSEWVCIECSKLYIWL